MNYKIEEKLKEIPIAYVREKALECWCELSYEYREEIEEDFFKNKMNLEDALFYIQANSVSNKNTDHLFWSDYISGIKNNNNDRLGDVQVCSILWRFQCETIFKSATPNEQLLKLQEEIEEIKHELDAENVDKAKLGTEIADGIIVLLSLAQSAGISTEDILFSYLPNKIFKNVNRNWLKLEDGTFKHVKE